MLIRLLLEERLPQHRDITLERLDAPDNDVLAGKQFNDGRRSVAVILHRHSDLARGGHGSFFVDVDTVDDATLPPLFLDDGLVNCPSAERGVHVDCNAARFSVTFKPSSLSQPFSDTRERHKHII